MSCDGGVTCDGALLFLDDHVDTARRFRSRAAGSNFAVRSPNSLTEELFGANCYGLYNSSFQ
jgi:hypothetical protein